MIFSRKINVTVEVLDTGLMKAVATMQNQVTDTLKVYNFKVEAIVSMDNFEIIGVEGVVINGLFPTCCEIIPKLQEVKGVAIRPGYSKKIIDIVGGKEGCTHMVELLTEIGRCVYQTYNNYIIRQKGIKRILEEYSSRSNIQCLGLSGNRV